MVLSLRLQLVNRTTAVFCAIMNRSKNCHYESQTQTIGANRCQLVITFLLVNAEGLIVSIESPSAAVSIALELGHSGSVFTRSLMFCCAMRRLFWPLLLRYLALQQRLDRDGIRHSRRCITKLFALESHFSILQAVLQLSQTTAPVHKQHTPRVVPRLEYLLQESL